MSGLFIRRRSSLTSRRPRFRMRNDIVGLPRWGMMCASKTESSGHDPGRRMPVRRGAVQGGGGADQRPPLPLPQLPEGDGASPFFARARCFGRTRSRSRARLTAIPPPSRLDRVFCKKCGHTAAFAWRHQRQRSRRRARDIRRPPRPLRRPSTSGSPRRWTGSDSTMICRNIRKGRRPPDNALSCVRA